MKRFALLVPASIMALLALTLSLSPGRAAEPAQPQVYDVWPGKPPGEIGNIGEEKFWDKRPDGKPIPDVGGKPVKWLTNVSQPTTHRLPGAKRQRHGRIDADLPRRRTDLPGMG